MSTNVYTTRDTRSPGLRWLWERMGDERWVRFRSVYRTVFIIPMVLAPVVVGIIFRLIYDTEFGMPNYILENILHLPRADWLGSPALALPSIMLMDIWQWTPFMFIVLLAGLQAIPVDLMEAGRVDGATHLQTLRRVI